MSSSKNSLASLMSALQKSIQSKKKTTNERNRIVKRLRQIHDVLKDTEQQEDEDQSMSKKMQQLVRVLSGLLDHTHDDVRLLLSCCFVDIFRLCAPEPPCDDEMTVRIFDVIVKQLKRLKKNDDSSFERCFYILESLSDVKSCLVLVALCEDSEDRDCARLVELFHALLGSLNLKQNSKVDIYVADIVQACIEEFETPPRELLECVLTYLVNDSSNDDSATRSYRVVQMVLKQQLVQQPVQQYMSMLVQSHAKFKGKKMFSKNVNALIREVYHISPDLMIYALPQITKMLKLPDSESRLRTTNLLCEMYEDTASIAGASTFSGKNFTELMGRCRDKDPRVRRRLVSLCVELIASKNVNALSQSTRSFVESKLLSALSDPDATVRQGAAYDICDAALSGLSRISETLLRAVAERVKDKKATIARDAITGLVQVYRAWTYEIEEDEEKEEEETDNDKEDIEAEITRLSTRREDSSWKKKLSWIPGTLYMCLSRKEDIVRDRVFQLSDDILLPRTSTVMTRTASMIQVYESLDESESRGFEMMFKKRAHLQKRLRDYLETRNHKEATSGDGDVKALSILQSVASIAAEQMNRKLQHKIAKQLHTQKNKRVFKLLDVFANPSSSIQTLRKSRTSLLSAVGSKSELANFLRFLLRKISMLTLNADSVPFLVQASSRENKAATSLLHMISVYVPGMFDVAISSLETHLCNKIETFVKGSSSSLSQSLTETLKLICRLDLKHIATSKRQIYKASQASLRKMRRHLMSICTGSTKDFSGRQKRVQQFTSVHCKFASRALLLDESDEEDLTELLDQTVLNLDIDDERLSCALRIFGEFVTHDAERLEKTAIERVWNLVVGSLGLLSEENKDSVEWESFEDAITSDNRVLALKTLTRVGMLSEAYSEKTLKILGTILEGLDSESTSSSVFTTSSSSSDNIDLTGLQDLSNDEDSYLRAALRVTAAKSVLRIAKTRALSIDMYHRLAWVLLDSSDEARMSVLDAVIKRINRNEVSPLMYMAMMIVSANDPLPSIRQKSTSKLLYFVRTRHRESKAWLASRQANEESEDVTTRAMSLTMAEYMLPYALHLVAHIPTFSDRPMSDFYMSEDFKAEKSSIAKFLRAALTPLLKIRNRSTCSVVFEILDRVAQSIDALKPKNANTRLLAEIAQKMLLDEFHFDQIDREFCRVVLPATMYVNSGNKKKRPSPSKSEEASPRRVRPRKTEDDLENSSQNRAADNDDQNSIGKKRKDEDLNSEVKSKEKKRKKKQFTAGFGKIDESNIVSGSRRRMR